MIERFLRGHPELCKCNISNLFERFLEASDGTLLCVYNRRRDTYEIHSLKSFAYDGDSLNVVLDEDTLHGWSIINYRSTDLKKFAASIASERQLTEHIFEYNEGKGLNLLTDRALKTVERTIGRDL